MIKVDPKVCKMCDSYYEKFLKAEKVIDSGETDLGTPKVLKAWNAILHNLDICIKKGWTIKDYEQRHRHDKEE